MREGRTVHVADGSTFAPAMALLPDGLCQDVECLYGVLRRLDDLVDEDDPRAAARVEAVERWARGREGGRALAARAGGRRATARGCGRHTHPAAGIRWTPETEALQALAARRPAMGAGALTEFCEGMRHDIAREGIEDESDLMRYCRRAGGSVGEVLAGILGAAREDDRGRREARRLMAVLGEAMQVTNILRDIDEDSQHGRLYIPRTMIERHCPADRPSIAGPGRREGLVRALIARAEALYEEGERAIPLLAEGGEAMAMAARLYRGILRGVEERELEAGRGSGALPRGLSTTREQELEGGRG